MTAPDHQPTAAGPETPRYAAYAQLIRMLLPSTGCVVVYDADGELAWSSDGFDRPDLRELVELFRAQAHAVERNKGSVRRSPDGSAALVARLSAADGRDLGYALIELGRAHSVDHSMAVSLTRPLIEILSTQLASTQSVPPTRVTPQTSARSSATATTPIVTRATATTSAPADAGDGAVPDLLPRLDLLLGLGEVDQDRDDAVRQLLDRCATTLKLVSAAFCIPRRGLTVVAEPAASGPDQRKLLDSTRRHLLAWAQLNNKPMIVNRVGGDKVQAPFKILTCPVPADAGRAGGLLVLFRPAHGLNFEPIDVRVAGFVGRAALGVLREREDAATGLSSSAAFERALSGCLETSAQSLLLDIAIDELARIDDTFGPMAGDEIVERVAELIGRRLGPDDRACRWSDGRFGVLLPDRTTDEAQTFAVELAERVRSLDYRANGKTVPVSLHWGLAGPPPGATCRRWLAAAAQSRQDAELADAPSPYNGVPV